MLRPFEDEDIERVYEACQDEEIGRFTATLPSPYTRADAAGWIAAHDSLRMDGTGLDLAIDIDEVGLAGLIGLTTFDCARSCSRPLENHASQRAAVKAGYAHVGIVDDMHRKFPAVRRYHRP